MMRVYLLVSRLAGPFVGAILQRRVREGKEDAARLDERYGIAAEPRPEGRLAWIHAASIGEATSALPLIDALKSARPGLQVLLTTGTVTSAARMADLLPEGAVHQYLPVDTARAVRRFLRHWQPDLAVFIENEIWPRLIHETERAEIPMAMINARISEKSLRGWRRVPRMARRLLRAFRVIIAQDAATAGRLAVLGVQAEEGINLKALVAPPACDEAELEAMRMRLAGRRVWLAASTHAGEDETIVTVAEMRSGMITIIAPRHPERADQIAAICAAAELPVSRRSEDALPGTTSIYLADSLGEMGLWYRLASVALVGGSLVEGTGGHTPFEPAALGCGILHGPDVANFGEVYAAFAKAGAAREVETAPEIAQALDEMIERDGSARVLLREMTEAAEAVRLRLGGDLRPLAERLMAMADLKAEGSGEAA